MIITLKDTNPGQKMKKTIQLMIFLSALLGWTLSNAQVINPEKDTVKWEYGKVQNNLRSESVTISGHFITYGNNGLLWVQNGMDHKYAFEVKSVKGSWCDVSENGELVYGAICEGLEGTVPLYRQRKDVIIQIDFAQPDKLSPNIDLQINSFSKN
jgi:hypothetical protein